MMSEMQFRSWVAIVFGQATPEEQEQGIGQLLLASGLTFGAGKDDPATKLRLDKEKSMMGELAKKARFAAGERVQFKNPNAEITANVAANPGKPKAIKPAGAVSNDPKRDERLKR